MLLAIWGPHAIGKTTFVNHLAGSITNTPNLLWLPEIKRLHIVLADNNREWSTAHGWQKSINSWKTTQIAKRTRLDNLIADDSCLYIVESARYFSGMYAATVASFKQAHGGLYFIIATTSPDNMQQFMRQRCLMNGRRYLADFWRERARYESKLRYTNPATKWFQPAGIPFSNFDVDHTRSVWYGIDELVWKLIMLPTKEWYD